MPVVFLSKHEVVVDELDYSRLKNYKKGYDILLNNLEYMPEEKINDIHKKLQELNL